MIESTKPLPEPGPDDLAVEHCLDGHEDAPDLGGAHGTARVAEGLELQRRIDATLRSLFVPPAPAGVVEDTEPAALPSLPPMRKPRGTPMRHVHLFRPALAAAAALLVAALGWWSGVPQRYLLGMGPPRPSVTADVLYTATVQSGFTPAWTCKDDREFAEVTGKRFGQQMLVKPTPGLQLVGWSYGASVLGNDSAYLLARAGGREIMVLVDKRDNDAGVTLAPEQSGLHLFRRTLGSLVLYEVSPLEKPAVIELAYDPARDRH